MATVGPGKCAGCGDNHWLGEPCDKKDRKILSLKKQLAARDAEIERLKVLVDKPELGRAEMAAMLEAMREDHKKVSDENKRLREALDKLTERRFPIQDGPSVPWSVVAPFEAQAQKNHGQSLERLAERGGLGASEAWALVKCTNVFELERLGQNHLQMTALWFSFAEKHNRAALAQGEKPDA